MLKEAPVAKGNAVNPNFGSTKEAIKNSVIDFLADDIAEYCQNEFNDIIELYDNNDDTLFFTMVQKPYQEELDEFINTIYSIGAWITKRYNESKIEILVIEQGNYEYWYNGEIKILWL